MNRNAKDSERCLTEGRYANYFETGHNACEFILNFGQFHEENGKPYIHTRVITGPVYAKAFYRTLHEAIEKYEKIHGSIDKSDEVSGVEY
jgi:hypothetical protein